MLTNWHSLCAPALSRPCIHAQGAHQIDGRQSLHHHLPHRYVRRVGLDGRAARDALHHLLPVHHGGAHPLRVLRAVHTAALGQAARPSRAQAARHLGAAGPRDRRDRASGAAIALDEGRRVATNFRRSERADGAADGRCVVARARARKDALVDADGNRGRGWERRLTAVLELASSPAGLAAPLYPPLHSPLHTLLHPS